MMETSKSLELERARQSIVKDCRTRVKTLLKTGAELFSAIFPSAWVTPGTGQRFEAERVFEYKTRQINDWVTQVMKDGLTLAQATEPMEFCPAPMRLPQQIAEECIGTLIKLFTLNRDLSDNDFYYIADVAAAAGLDTPLVARVIEQAQYEIRKVFFQGLIGELDEEQCMSCAILLMKAIQADEELHPAEFKYLENISQLLDNDQSKIEKVEQYCAEQAGFPRVFLPDDLAIYMYKYLTEVVMCDGEYDARESAFIKDVGAAFGFDHTRQDKVIQPVSAAMMVKAALFPRK
ncbi:MAG: hypothetical protein A2508_05020 [Candidatus Lambdaproteobacteria bacterium RIFOXYD12_FULL_49_8]|uniref:Co-chaperone DjlA N-terminal domain-containing protein n=1 Tax=Candidatus Lambdaproteobacteria bacterium RIFOXYD2_FULL_50_16 TaxID=1817772 RepID=A0A1F6GB43_9PROT|nr:MAG: hypothetical protein A2527_07330 [Candidatus Lambdaproteobacteria bacterium RIFOXYD2_FULL_50_16]OGG96203.1 MAG: hypothetical protein A2508_05020 [Candidatus Lambdaproteobacteria bacterium RIFOXYD12_FULL_49_8]